MTIRVKNTFSKIRRVHYEVLTVKQIKDIYNYYNVNHIPKVMISQLERFDKPLNKNDLVFIYKSLNTSFLDYQNICETMSEKDLLVLIRNKLYNTKSVTDNIKNYYKEIV